MQIQEVSVENKYLREDEDVGNVQLLEHVNLTVPDQSIASMFYVTGLGFTRDPYIDFGTFNMWINLGDQQFHLPTNKAQILRGHIGLVVPDLDELLKRLNFASKGLQNTQFSYAAENDFLALTCPYGNKFKVYAPSSYPRMDIGIAYIQFDVPTATTAGIARFYEQVLGCPAQHSGDIATVAMGHNQQLIFCETQTELTSYDGHHIAIYISNFSAPHSWLSQRGLISEESDQYQYRFQNIVEPESGELLYELEHEVRSLSHPMYRRCLVNRNASTNFFTYRKGNEQFTPAPRN